MQNNHDCFLDSGNIKPGLVQRLIHIISNQLLNSASEDKTGGAISTKISIHKFFRSSLFQMSPKQYRASDQSADGSITGHDLLLTYKQYLNNYNTPLESLLLYKLAQEILGFWDSLSRQSDLKSKASKSTN